MDFGTGDPSDDVFLRSVPRSVYQRTDRQNGWLDGLKRWAFIGLSNDEALLLPLSTPTRPIESFCAYKDQFERLLLWAQCRSNGHNYISRKAIACVVAWHGRKRCTLGSTPDWMRCEDNCNIWPNYCCSSLRLCIRFEIWVSPLRLLVVLWLLTFSADLIRSLQLLVGWVVGWCCDIYSDSVWRSAPRHVSLRRMKSDCYG